MAALKTGSTPMRKFQIFLVLVMSAAVSGRAQAQQTQQTPPAAPAGSAAPSGAAATTSATPAPPPSTGSPIVDPSTYTIGADDVLQVSVWREPTLSGTIPVRPDGMISLALIGDMAAAGKTPMQLATEITSKLKKYVQDPNVYVVVTAVNSQRVFVIGEVGHVGPIGLTPAMTPLQAIAAAGGITPFENSKRIYILRGPQGKQQKIPFNYKAAFRGDSSQDIPLQPGDTIVVP
jgi:polysaccharide biosynthesis/export protein